MYCRSNNDYNDIIFKNKYYIPEEVPHLGISIQIPNKLDSDIFIDFILKINTYSNDRYIIRYTSNYIYYKDLQYGTMFTLELLSNQINLKLIKSKHIPDYQDPILLELINFYNTVNNDIHKYYNSRVKEINALINS